MADDFELGKKFGRPDTERVGLFSEMPYMIGKGYVSPFAKLKGDKGKNLLCGGPKIKDGTQEAYFDKEFKRLFIGEAIKNRHKPKKQGVKFMGGRPFMPNGPSKKHSSPGDYYGTFSGVIEHFSNVRKPKPKAAPTGKSFVIGATKMGGCGYADITLSKYPEHLPDRYGLKPKYKEYGAIIGRPLVPVHYPQPCFDKNPFKDPDDIKPGPTYVPPKDPPGKKSDYGRFIPTGPAKWQGGSHAGCFDKFPEHMKEPYLSVLQTTKMRESKKREGVPVFSSQCRGPISFYTDSIINHEIPFRVNTRTESTIQPTYIKYLVD